jgi:hypothetical protein
MANGYADKKMHEMMTKALMEAAAPMKVLPPKIAFEHGDITNMDYDKPYAYSSPILPKKQKIGFLADQYVHEYFDSMYFAQSIEKEFGYEVTRMALDKMMTSMQIRVMINLRDGDRDFNIIVMLDPDNFHGDGKLVATDILLHYVRGHIASHTDQHIDYDNPKANHLRQFLKKVRPVEALKAAGVGEVDDVSPLSVFHKDWASFLYPRGLRPDWKYVEVWYTMGLVQVRGDLIIPNSSLPTKVIRELTDIHKLHEPVYDVLIYLMNEAAMSVIRSNYGFVS